MRAEAEKAKFDAQALELDVSCREQELSGREQDMSRQHEETKTRIVECTKRLRKLETDKKDFQAKVSMLENDLKEIFGGMEEERNSIRERCQLAIDSANNAPSIQAEVKKEMVQVDKNMAWIDRMAKRLTDNGPTLDKKLKEVESFHTQVSAELQKFQQAVVDNKQWVVAKDNSAMTALFSLPPALHRSVLGIPTPLNVDRFRLLMASQEVKAVKEELQDRMRNGLICTSFY